MHTLLQETSAHVCNTFTLVELMIVVAIIGILASVGIPSFQDYVLQAKFAESYSNIGAIQKAQTVYFNQNGFFLSAQALSGNTLPTGGDRASLDYSGGFSAWDELGRPLVAGEHFFNYTTLAGSFNSAGDEVTMSLVDGEFEEIANDFVNGINGSKHFEDAEAGYHCANSIDGASFANLGIQEVPSEHFAATIAGHSFTQTNDNLCSVVLQIIRVRTGEGVSMSPFIVLHKGE